MIKDEIKNLFIKFLRDNGHRITNERFLILDSALSMESHFDADELYIKMSGDYIRVSRATVYNTLELMNGCNILTKHNFKGDRARYETKYGRKNHYHIICLSCNTILEFENDSIGKTLDKICKGKELKLLDHSLQVFASCYKSGHCNCRKIKSRANSNIIKSGKSTGKL
ncbi:MAG: transcriptional repressor [Ignavibacteriae bacterium]|nr:transcriptional repressor [Ignavibacteriota bacterium]